MKRDDRSPQAYRQAVEGDLGAMLETVRSIVFQVKPDVAEGIKHGMLWYPGVAYLAAQKHYVALYVDPAVLDGFRARFGDCGKSCVRFRRPEHLDRAGVQALLQAAARASG